MENKGVDKMRKIKIVFIFTVCLVLMTSCGKKDNEQSTSAKKPTQSPQVTTQTSDKPQEKIIDIYTINEDTLEVEAAKATIVVDTELTANDIVNAVIDGLNFKPDYIGLNSVTEEDDAVIVDFQKDKPPVDKIGSAGESAILDCISKSLLDNLASCNKVIVHVDGEKYQSGHLAYEYDEPYKWK